MKEAALSGSEDDHFAERPKRQVPGFIDLHRKAILLLGERVPAQGRRDGTSGANFGTRSITPISAPTQRAC